MIDFAEMSGKPEPTSGGRGFPMLIFGLLTAVLLLTGCATRKEIVRFKEDAVYIKAKLDTLEADVRNLRMQTEGLYIRQDRLLEEMVSQSDMRQYRAYMGSRLDDYEASVLMISAQINDLSQRLTGVAQRMDQIKYQPNFEDSLDSDEAVAPQLKELYDQAYYDLTRGNYELASAGFAEYLRLYPDTELADNALYWMGETEYTQHNYAEALTIFEQVAEKYPKGNKVPAALFKIGLCQIALGRDEDAKITLESLIMQYPASAESQQAKARLKELE